MDELRKTVAERMAENMKRMDCALFTRACRDEADAHYAQAAAEDHASRVDHHQRSEMLYHTQWHDHERSR